MHCGHSHKRISASGSCVPQSSHSCSSILALPRFWDRPSPFNIGAAFDSLPSFITIHLKPITDFKHFPAAFTVPAPIASRLAWYIVRIYEFAWQRPPQSQRFVSRVLFLPACHPDGCTCRHTPFAAPSVEFVAPCDYAALAGRRAIAFRIGAIVICHR